MGGRNRFCSFRWNIRFPLSKGSFWPIYFPHSLSETKSLLFWFFLYFINLVLESRGMDLEGIWFSRGRRQWIHWGRAIMGHKHLGTHPRLYNASGIFWHPAIKVTLLIYILIIQMFLLSNLAIRSLYCWISWDVHWRYWFIICDHVKVMAR